MTWNVRVTSTVVLVSLALFCGGWVKGVFGMGLPTVALGLLWFFIGLIALGAYSVIRATLQIVR
jgi:hypothetical protein